MSYADRDKYGMYKDTGSAGPGPALMGADTLIGDSVVNGANDDLAFRRNLHMRIFGSKQGLPDRMFAAHAAGQSG